MCVFNMYNNMFWFWRCFKTDIFLLTDHASGMLFAICSGEDLFAKIDTILGSFDGSQGFFHKPKRNIWVKWVKMLQKKCMQHLDRAKNCKLCENVAVKTMLCLPYQLTWSLSCVIHWKATGKHCLSHVTPFKRSIPGTLLWLDSWCWRHHFGR